MISPPVTLWPAKTFTPRRLAFESRPLRLEPSPFLCGMVFGGASGRLGADFVHPDARELLAVALAALVAALRLVLEDPNLRATLVAQDRGGHLRRAQRVGAELGIAVAGDQQRLELDRRTLVVLQALDE